MAKKTKKDSAIEKAYYTYFNCIGVNIFDVPKIWRAIEKILSDGGDTDTAMKNLVAAYRVS